MLLSPMRTLGISLGLAQRATAAGARLFQILDREPRITSHPGAPALPAGSGRVELRDVTLAYEGTARPALEDVSLTVEAGTTVALVGATGSGKTTLVQLIPRLYDVTAGAVLLDGVDVRDVDVRSLRAQVAVVDDAPFLFSASIAENIAYARADATLEEVQDAARHAQAHDFIARLPEGYDTQVGERGLTLSGGQRQRVAIARALPGRPARPRPRRRDLVRRRLDGAGDQGRAARGHGRPDDLRHRPPPLDDLPGRRDRRARGRRACSRTAGTTSCSSAPSCTARSSRRACPTRSS